MIMTIALIAAGAGLVAWALSDQEESQGEVREIWLVNGTQYALTWFEPNVTNVDEAVAMLASMGFCNVEEFTLMPPGGTFYVRAYWCQVNTLWQVPENVSISAL